MRNSLANRYGIELPATVVFDHPSPDALADFIGKQLAASLPPVLTDASGSEGKVDPILASSAEQQLTYIAGGRCGFSSVVVSVSCRYPGSAQGALTPKSSNPKPCPRLRLRPLTPLWPTVCKWANESRPIRTLEWKEVNQIRCISRFA